MLTSALVSRSVPVTLKLIDVVALGLGILASVHNFREVPEKRVVLTHKAASDQGLHCFLT